MTILKGKRVLVTGSRGFVGARLVERLAQEGADVTGLDISDGTDITDWRRVENIDNVDIIYHLAARTYIPSTSADPRQTYWTNLTGTLNMLELGRRNNVEKLVYASAYVYGQPQYLPVDERHPLHPVNPYNRSKLLGEELCRAYREEHGIKCVVLRAFNLYGAGQGKDFLIPTILNQMNGDKIRLNDGEPRRDYLYVEDALEAYVKAAGYARADYAVFNIGYGKSYRVDEIVKTVLSLTGRVIPVEYLNRRRKNEIMDVVADISLAKKELGWEPRFTLEEGLRQYLCHMA